MDYPEIMLITAIAIFFLIIGVVLLIKAFP